ncbi:hypothetical protein [uncultured Microbulbifer sp.]|uniref:hypothetical protein n=1 Tax=uncultured Microbulbifer sp. TaxID=348147 RepID=UPI0025D58F86|nr:hypothetical protein [uncultured Microbulbifer sp.]
MPESHRPEGSTRPETGYSESEEAVHGQQHELDQLLERGEATLTLATAWFQNLTTLVQLEFNRTLEASKRIAALLLMLLPLAIALVLSLCGGLGLLGYYFTQSIYIGFGIFLVAQILILVGILLYLRNLRAMLGFDETTRQTKEALNDVAEIFK